MHYLLNSVSYLKLRMPWINKNAESLTLRFGLDPYEKIFDNIFSIDRWTCIFK